MNKYTSWGVFVIAVLVASVPAVNANPLALDLGGLTNDGALIGNFNEYTYELNTDNGAIYQHPSALPGSLISDGSSTRIVAQGNGGPDVRIFDFSSFDVSSMATVHIYGNLPVVILSQNGFNIGGRVVVDGAGGAAVFDTPGYFIMTGQIDASGEIFIDAYGITNSGIVNTGGGGGIISTGGGGTVNTGGGGGTVNTGGGGGTVNTGGGGSIGNIGGGGGIIVTGHVPEPGSLTLFVLGIALLRFRRR
jgi:hypothetical protein